MLHNKDCWLNIEKPLGYSSAKVVAIVKKITNAKKVGHGGTLDPFACGVLPIALNKATKTAEKLMTAKKGYLFNIKFGEFRDSDDIEGKVEKTCDTRTTANNLAQILFKFIGKIDQTPSKFSAIKINGNRAYDLARQGHDFAMPKRQIEIYQIKLLHFDLDNALIAIECSKGTYVRSLARSICLELGICGYVSYLKRLKVGKFLSNQTISLDELKAKVNNDIIFLDGTMLLLHDVS
ncbi:MAG: tRNA pseudouridine(55) synthase TruB [Alphaproteobacteria bacterium]